MPKSIDVFCSDLADNLLLYKDTYTLYQASPFVELTQDTMTPDRAHGGSRLLCPNVPTYWDAYPRITSTPRSFFTPSTSSRSVVNTQMVFSPSPLPVSKVPSLVFPEISPPSQGSGSTPFERQFVGDFSREWCNINTQISPVARRDYHSSFSSPVFSNAVGTPRTDYDPTSQDSQDVVGRVSLINRFISAAADESATTENDIPYSTLSSQDRSSPLSDLSDLTSLSSPEYSGRFGRGFDLRSSSPPTSPTAERPNDLSQYKDQPPSSGRDSSSIQSTRSSSRSRDSDYQPAKGTTGCKRKRTPRNRDGNEIPIKRKKIRSARAPSTNLH
ncbi:hypothetical protein J3R83DRAFT_9425 [Lanmaoa asiatica]|nr:hypothetical protein J3R83DRAFT_9425 [Lanmaoa asiatica]